jgi:hypothetical protein
MNKQIINPLAGLLLLTSLSALAQITALPDQGGQIHNGVASCATSTCHGAVRPFAESNILHNEFITWTREDRHSKAYQTLLSPASKQIAKKMGIGAPHTEVICLDCHTSNISQKQRGAKFQLNDGIGCESCHGGSGKWLTSHTAKNATYADNIRNGLYPLADPVSRAQLCQSCHYGNDKKFVTHTIMGAGHPRLSFELDTFTQLMPAHFVVDADYKKRKDDAGIVKTWALGQLAAALAAVAQIQSPRIQANQLFPELSLFDCHACHHPMSDLRWRPRSGTGLGPGIVRFGDAHLVMARNALMTVAPRQAEELQKLTVSLHKATNSNAQNVKDAATRIQTLLQQAIKPVEQYNFTSKDAFSMIRNLIEDGLRGEYQDYAAAEQTTMALSGMLAYLDAEKALKPNQQKPAQQSLDRLYACVNNDERYQDSCFINELRKFKTLLGI